MTNYTTISGQTKLDSGLIVFHVTHRGEYREYVYKQVSEVIKRLRRDDLSTKSEERV